MFFFQCHRPRTVIYSGKICPLLGQILIRCLKCSRASFLSSSYSEKKRLLQLAKPFRSFVLYYINYSFLSCSSKFNVSSYVSLDSPSSDLRTCILNTKSFFLSAAVNPIQDGSFRGCSRMGGEAKRSPSLNLCRISYNDETWQTYTLTKKNHVTHSFSSADISIFIPEIRKFCYIKKCRYRLYSNTFFLILLTFF